MAAFDPKWVAASSRKWIDLSALIPSVELSTLTYSADEVVFVDLFEMGAWNEQLLKDRDTSYLVVPLQPGRGTPRNIDEMLAKIDFSVSLRFRDLGEGQSRVLTPPSGKHIRVVTNRGVHFYVSHALTPHRFAIGAEADAQRAADRARQCHAVVKSAPVEHTLADLAFLFSRLMDDSIEMAKQSAEALKQVKLLLKEIDRIDENVKVQRNETLCLAERVERLETDLLKWSDDADYIRRLSTEQRTALDFILPME